jgi:pyrimidine oxygenase
VIQLLLGHKKLESTVRYLGTLVGSYASVAKMLDEVASVPGAEGVLLTFDDFLLGVETFGERIQPLMQCRAHIPAITREVA